MKRLLFISLLLPCFCFGQNPEIKRTWNWYFGYNAGLDFSSGQPVALVDGAMYVSEGNATISDVNGNLLFYTSGVDVWNKNHQIMTNGTGLWAGNSTSQAALIVPQPQSDSLYYVFTVPTQAGTFGGYGGIAFSVVDMSLQGGLGEVITKNTPLLTPTTEKLTAVHHTNGEDIWVMTHEWESYDFYCWKVTSAGLDTVPVVNTLGMYHGGGPNSQFAVGAMKVSPQGTKLAVCNNWGLINANLYGLEVFDFNASTGVITNPIRLLLPQGYYSVEFSPDGSKLYGTSGGAFSTILQWDLLAGDSTAINNSAVAIGQFSSGGHGMQLGPDCKIYVTRRSMDSLGVINYPNASGIACNYVKNGVSLNGKDVEYGLPNFITSYFVECSPMSIQERTSFEGIHLYPNPTTGKFTVQGATGEIQVYDLFGRLVLRTNKPEIDMSNYPAGLYVWQVGTQRGKLVLE